MAGFVLAVTSAAQDGHDDAFNDWYDKHHFGEMLAIPGVVAGRRLQASPGSPNPPPARYLTEFDLEIDDPQAFLGEMSRRLQSGEMSVSETLDQSKVQLWIYERR